MTQYFTDVLQKPTSGLDVPDLQSIAKDHNVAATLIMCRLTIAIGVQCEKNKQFIDKIQGLSEVDQHHLMKAIEQVSRQDKQCLIMLTEGSGHGTDYNITWKSRCRRSQHDRVRPFIYSPESK